MPSKSFQRDVMEKVENYFSDNKLTKHANAEMVIKTILILSVWAGTYAVIISNLVSPLGMLGLALIHGICCALIGLNIGHDAIHGSYTNSSKVNQILGLGFNLVGANDYVWSISHNIVHHTYTNIPHYDEDIQQVPILRIDPSQERWNVHKYQHIYAYFLYTLTTISWVFRKDYVKFFQHQLGGHYRKTFPRKEIIRLVSYKIFYYAVFVVTPFLLIDLSWYWILLGFIAAHFVEGMTLALIFMLGHIIEGTQYPEPDEKGHVDMTWAELQVKTSANFAIKNRLVNFFCGGLNFQIEHHLFPRVCHVHYPKIAKIVEDTAKEYGLPYMNYPTFFGAIASHTRLLKAFGTEDRPTLKNEFVA